MELEYFNRSEVLESIRENGYFIHNHTFQKAREEVIILCKDLSKELGIEVIETEIEPACDFGVLYRNDKFPGMKLTEDQNVEALIMEIENYRE